MYSIRVYPFSNGQYYYELYCGYNRGNSNKYPIHLAYSKKVTKILFLKGIVLEDRIVKDIDMDIYDLLYPYTVQYSTR
jgi:hypothetical protein